MTLRWRSAATAIFVFSCLLVVLSANPAHSRSVVNLESLAATVFLIGISFSSAPSGAVSPSRRSLWLFNRSFLAALIPIALPFLITLKSPFLFDSYAHLVNASQENASQALRFFYQHPAGGDFFFRPLGQLDYWVESQWASFSPVAWRLGGLALHLLSVALVLLLCRALALSKDAALLAALLFGLHGSNPEVVSWTAARFDELATGFTAATLLLLCRYNRTGKGFVFLLLAGSFALLSKESAFCLPGLAICILAFKGEPLDRRKLRAVAGLAIVTLLVLLYRAWVLGGIGGYRTETGGATVFQFNVLHFLELFSFRMWAVLLFPINWSAALPWWLLAALFVFVIGGGWTLLVAQPNRRKMAAAIAFCMLALLPAYHLSLLDATLLGSRVFHLALIGWVLLFGLLYDSTANAKVRLLLALSLCLFQAAALCHNLFLWRDTARLAGQICAALPDRVTTAQPVVITNLPDRRNGAYFLSNAFPECVFVNSGKHIQVFSQDQPGVAAKRFRWDESSQSLLEVR